MKKQRTVRLDAQLLAMAKIQAATTGRSVTALIEDALRAFLALDQRPGKPSESALPTFGTGGVLRGVDLYNSPTCTTS